MTIISLLTDFGTRDEYAGVLKGVIAGINPAAVIIDVTHGIAPQNVTAAAYALKASFPFFPQGTIHMAVVDPGVGTQRRIVAAQCMGHVFLAPDNGLLFPVIAAHSPHALYRVENENLFRQPVSRTFHGRDVFAPVAAHLSKGLPVKALGRPLDFSQLRPLAVQEPRKNISGELEGQVVGVDRFGNLITNISDKHLGAMGPGKLSIFIGDHAIERLTDSYAQGPPGVPLAIIGSRACLEIFVNGGHAAGFLNMGQGQVVHVKART